MITSIWNTIVYEPLYNALAFILSHTGGYAWLGIVILTVTIRLILFPLYQNMIRTQKKMRDIQPVLKELQEKYKTDRAKLGMETLELYKKNKVNPFSLIGFLVFIQIPVFLGLYFVFAKGLIAHEGYLYSFISFPDIINSFFFNIDLLVKGSFVIALLAGIAQYVHSRHSLSLQPELPERKKDETPSFSDELQRSLRFQTLYFIPILITVTAYFFPAAIGLYWIVNSVFSIMQERFVSRV